MSEGPLVGTEAGGSEKKCMQAESGTETSMAERDEQQVAAERPSKKKDNQSIVPDALDVDRLLADGISVCPIRAKVSDKEKSSSEATEYTFSCGVCRNKLFNDLAAVNKHVALDMHSKRIEEAYVEGFLHQSPKLTQAQCDASSRLVEDIYHQHSAVVSDQVIVRRSIAMELDKIVKRALPDVSVRLFGSSVTQFVLDSSNVNLDLNIGDPETNQKRIPSIMKTCLAALQHDAGPFYEVKDDFYSALRVPQIIFKHHPSGLVCELRAATAKPIELASILNLYGGLDPRAIKLGVAFKYWARVHKLDLQSHGHYAPHIFVMMVLHYLQQVHVLPVLHELAVEANKAEVSEAQEEGESGDKTTPSQPDISMDQLSSLARQWTTKNTLSLGELWIGLLKYYATEFSFGTRAVTIRQLTPLLRKDRDWGSARIAVEDPTIPRNNVTRGANSDAIFDYLVICLKRTACYFMQLQGRLEWLLSNSPPLSAHHVLVRIFNLSNEACVPMNKDDEKRDRGERTNTIPVSKEVAVATIDKEEEEKDIVTLTAGAEIVPIVTEKPSMDAVTVDAVTLPTDVEISPTNTETPLEADTPVSPTDGEPSPPADGEGPVVEKNSKKTAGLGGWKKTAKKISKQLCDIVLTESPVYSLKDSYMCKKNIPYACLLCRRNNHLAPKCPDEGLPRFIRPPQQPHPTYIGKLEMTFRRYVKQVAPSDAELRDRYQLRDFILKDIHKIFPKAALELFGSSANGFGSYDSDVDLCLILNEEYTCEKAEIILQVTKELKKKKVYIKIQPITSARVPIVKFFVTKWDIECDVSLENILALHNTRLLAMYGQIDDRVRVLGYVVKCFAKVCDMCDAGSGSLSSYAYILMLIHFLQQTQPPVLPVLQELHDGSSYDKPVPVDQWNCYYFQPKGHIELLKVWKPKEVNRLPPGLLWLEFLWYFVQHFDWRRQVVTIKQLRPLSKFDKLWQVKPMCIEDPFNLDHNLAQAVSTKMRIYILMRFKKAYSRHCEERPWRDIAHVMDKNALCGEFRAPKFIICDFCNYRGHRSAECPRKANGVAEKRAQRPQGRDEKGSKHRGPEAVSKEKPVKPTPDKQAVVETDGTEVSQDKKPVAKTDDASTPTSESLTKLPQASSNDEDTSTASLETLGYSSSVSSLTTTTKDKEIEGMPSRSEIKEELLEQCQGSLRKARKLNNTMKKKAYCKGATDRDRIRYSVMLNILKKMQTEAMEEGSTAVKQSSELDSASATSDSGSSPELLLKHGKKSTEEKLSSKTEIKLELLDQCHGSIEEAQRLLVELKRKSRSKGATDFDRKRFRIITGIFMKMQEAAKKEAVKQSSEHDAVAPAKSVDEATEPSLEASKHKKKKKKKEEELPSRAEIRREILEQCHDSEEERQKLLLELKGKTGGKEATKLDKKRFSVMLHIIKEMQKKAALTEELPVAMESLSLQQPREHSSSAPTGNPKPSKKASREKKPVTVIVQPNKKTDLTLKQTAKELQKLHHDAVKHKATENESPFHDVPLVTAMAPLPSLLGDKETPVAPPVPYNTPQAVQLTGSHTPPSPPGPLKYSTSPSGSPRTPPSPSLTGNIPQTPPSPLTAFHHAPLLHNPLLPASVVPLQPSYYPGTIPAIVPAKPHPLAASHLQAAASGTPSQPHGLLPQPLSFPVGAFPTPIHPSTGAMAPTVFSHPGQAVPAPPLIAAVPRATTGLPLATPGQPMASYAGQPMTSYAGQPMTSYAGQPMTPYAGQPMTPYAGQPMTPYAGQPVTSQPVMTTYSVTPYISQP